eukprot:CAMPEP_0173414784 /NCGR_PEP_ID=MMETSP1356-20130122/84512_1 /TAXON_ID=77927 ORGANISM="Hemiselmis virescens, Strain PCC157" /NCGR_SAMPLE_ID=MMETSP1356 /ASSEMBLY_ACC=CAM_ASM_000847 /LENGTH=245 /DNA_ID=CAMNT_0014376987 /DNA_START=1000 /DNA_END=1734 /DNA_ORIENTATION=-
MQTCLKASPRHSTNNKAHMTWLWDLPQELLPMYCPGSHQNMLRLALCNNIKPAVLINPSRREVEWTNHNLPSIGVVLYSHSFSGFDPHHIVRLTLIDPHEQLSALVNKPAVLINPSRREVEWTNHNLPSIGVVLYSHSFSGFDPHHIVRLTLIDPHEQLSALVKLARLTHLTIAFSTACDNIPRECKLSKICPPCVEQIKLMGAPVVVVDKLPATCSSLSVTRCKTIIFEVPTRSLKELRLHECK